MVQVAIDLIGPWSAKFEHFSDEFYALTCIDTTTNLVELTCIDTKSNDVIEGNLNKPSWLGIIYQYTSSMTKMENLEDMPLTTSFTFWESKMSPK